MPAAPPAKLDRAVAHVLLPPEVTATVMRVEPTMSDLQISKRIYALLVGIDAYRPPIPRSSTAASTISTPSRPSFGHRTPRRRTSSPCATSGRRDAVIAGFREHLSEPRPATLPFLLRRARLAGAAPPEFWHLEPDRLDETLVCYDSRRPGEVGPGRQGARQADRRGRRRRGPRSVILDCCHSGSGRGRVGAP